MSQTEPTEFDRDATAARPTDTGVNASGEDAPRSDREAARALYEAKKREQELRREAKRAEKAERVAEKKRSATAGEKPAKRDRAAKNTDTSQSNGSRIRRGRKSAADAEVSANRREIPVSGFDLLGGSFAKTARVRIISVVVISIMLGVELLVGLRGVSAKIEESGVRRNIADVAAERQRVISAFGASTGIEGVTEVQIIERERALSAALREAVLSQPDIIGLYSDLRRFDGLGVSVISITASRPVVKRPTAESDEKPAPAAPAPTTPVVTITAEATDFGSIVAWTKRVQELPQLQEVTSTRQGLKVTISAQFSPQYVAAAGADLLTALGVSLNTTTEPTTETGGNP